MMTLRHLVLVAGLALVAQPVPAVGAPRGFGGSGGYPHPGVVNRGGSAPGNYYRPAYVGRYPYPGGYRGGYYGRPPLYGGYRGGYYRRPPYYGGFYSFGWPYYGAYRGGYYPGYTYAPGVVNDYDNPAPDDTAVVDSNGNDLTDADKRLVRLRLEVRPDDTSVYVDDQFQGSAREARMLYLPPGRHMIELVRPGFTTVVREVQAALGEALDVSVELLRP